MVEEMIHEDVGIEAELVKSRMKDFGDSIIEEEAEASVSNFGNKTN